MRGEYREYTPVSNQDVVQVVVHGALFPAVVEFLMSRGIDVGEMPGSEEEDSAGLRTFMTAPGTELWMKYKRLT